VVVVAVAVGRTDAELFVEVDEEVDSEEEAAGDLACAGPGEFKISVHFSLGFSRVPQVKFTVVSLLSLTVFNHSARGIE